ncbi:MAG: hypothetical protein H0Z34_07785 [Brevibacillus sp.]|nr:hypothetical protein [Brevibacillus sp.]
MKDRLLLVKGHGDSPPDKSVFPKGKPELLELAGQRARRGQLRQAGRVMAAYVKLIKQEQASTLTEDLFAGVFLLSFWQEQMLSRSFHWQRKVDFLCACLASLAGDAFVRAIENAYLHSKQEQSFPLLFDVLKQSLQRLDAQPDKLFWLWYFYSSAKYYEKDFEEGYTSSLQALKYSEHTDETSLSHLLIRHGNLCLQLKKYNEALFSYLKGYNLLENATDSFSLACKVNIGRTYFKLYDYENARKYWEEVLAQTSVDDAIRINLLTDFTFLELTRGDFHRGRALYYETDRLLSHLTKKEKESYAIEAILHERNGALLWYPKRPKRALKQMLACAYKMINSPLKDEIFETVYLMIVLLTKYGNIFDEDDLQKLENLKKYID